MSISLTEVLDIIKSGGVVVTAVAASFAYRQLKLTRHNIDLVYQWNRLNAVFTYMDNDGYKRSEEAAAKILSQFSLDLYHEKDGISATISQAIINDPEKFKPVKDFLNTIEGYAAAMNAGAVVQDVAYGLRGDRIIRNFDVFRPLIEMERERSQNHRYWIEMEKIANKWRERRLTEKQNLAKLQQNSSMPRVYSHTPADQKAEIRRHE